jgi:hypothetical protein
MARSDVMVADEIVTDDGLSLAERRPRRQNRADFLPVFKMRCPSLRQLYPLQYV